MTAVPQANKNLQNDYWCQKTLFPSETPLKLFLLASIALFANSFNIPQDL